MIDTLTVVLTGVGTAAARGLRSCSGVWKMLNGYETRNDAAHADPGRRIDAVRVEVNGRIDKLYELLSTDPR